MLRRLLCLAAAVAVVVVFLAPPATSQVPANSDPQAAFPLCGPEGVPHIPLPADLSGTPDRIEDPQMAFPLCGPKGVPHIPLPADLSGTLDGIEYKIRVPANWNGALLLYAHETGAAGVEVAPPTSATSPTLEEQLLSLGYALAGSQHELSLKQGPRRILELTQFFYREVGRPARTIVWGMSAGGDITLALIERHPEIFDGAIPVAAEAGGWPNYADFLLRYDLAYAAAFGWPTDWWGPVEDLRDDLFGNEATLIMPVFQWASQTNYGQWEFIRLVMKESPKAWWESDFPGWMFCGWAGTAVRSGLEQEYGGPVSQNVGAFYSLTAEEKAYLSTLGVDADPLLTWMNAHTDIVADRRARHQLAHYGTPNGNLHRPVVMMQGIFDPIVVPSNDAVYGDLVEDRGKGHELVQVYVDTWHGPFSAEQYLAALAAMEHWLETGVRPGTSFFPESLGFDNNFVPPPWPY